MYTTKPRSSFEQFHGGERREGPNSGCLVLEDKELNTITRCCLGTRSSEQLRGLPFPQNRFVTIKHSGQRGKRPTARTAVVFFVPALGQPVWSNRYYAIAAKGRYRGRAYACTREDTISCCSCHGTKDPKPKIFDPRDIYQQMEIVRDKEGFTAKAVAPGARPPWLFGGKWNAYASRPKKYHLDIGEAPGLNSPLRARLPDINSTMSAAGAPVVVVGKWYCPFVFVKEGMSYGEQMKRTLFYEVTLEQFWEEIYACDNQGGDGNAVEVNALVESNNFWLDGQEVVVIKKRRRDGMVWLEPIAGPKTRGIGLSSSVWERIMSEERNGGWISDDDDQDAGRIVRVEECGEGGMWSKFACYVMVERFVFRRMDGGLALTLVFRHVIKLRTKWE